MALVSLAAPGGVDPAPLPAALAEPPARAITLDAEDDCEPLAYGQPIGFGEPWEEGVLDELNDFAQSGSGFAWFLRGDSGCWEAWRDTLEHFAIGQGLLMGASQANDWTRNQWNTTPENLHERDDHPRGRISPAPSNR